MNSAQNRAFHKLLNDLGLNNPEDKENIVRGATNGRTGSSRQMSWYEADETIRGLRSQSEDTNKLRRKVLSCCHQLGWYVRDPETNELQLRNNKPVLDMERIDSYCTKHGKGHKPLNEYKAEELRGNGGLIFQFEMMLKNRLNAQ